MSGDLAEFHAELGAVARDMLARAAGDRPGPDPAELDPSVLAEAGWLGLEVPEALGGAGATLAEVAVVLHEMGRAAACSSYLGSAVLGVGLCNLLEPGTHRDRLLAAIATGACGVAVALSTGEGAGGPPALPFALSQAGRSLHLRGTAPFVPDAPGAERLLVLSGAPDATPVVVELHPGEGGVEVTPQPVLDATRRLGQITADTRVDPERVRRFGGDPAAAVRALADRAALAMACDSLGLAEAMLEATVAYGAVRHQFGRPIGSFQAVQHACADMLVKLTVSRELVAGAVAALASDDPDAARAVSMAKSHVCAAAVEVVGKAMQLHGGIGYTWDSGVHAYLKRAVLNRSLFGSPAAHRRRLAARYGERTGGGD